MSRTRKPAEVRKDEILAATLKLCQINGIKSVTRKDIAQSLGVAEALVSHHFGTMKQLQRDILRHAIKQENIIVLAQCVAAGYAKPQDFPVSLCRAVNKYLNVPDAR